MGTNEIRVSGFRSCANYRLGDLLDHATRRLGFGDSRYVRLRENADEPAVFDDGKPAYLLLGHALKGCVQWLVGADEHRVLGPDVGDRHLVRVEVLRKNVGHQIAVGDDADELLLIHDGE